MKPNKHQKFRRAGLLSFLGLSLAACAGGPHGQNPPPHADNRPPPGAETPTGYAAKPIIFVFLELDTNGDRILTLTELETGLAGVWTEMDADASDTVTPLEYGAWADAILGDSLAHPTRIAVDTNLDGGITREEFTARMRHEFRELDQNGDQKLIRAEMIFRLPTQHIKRMSGPGGGIGSNGGRGMPPRGSGDGPR